MEPSDGETLLSRTGEGNKNRGRPPVLVLGVVCLSTVLLCACSPQCGLANSSDSDLGEVKKSFLTSGSVQSTGNGPIIVSAEQQYSRVVVMRRQAVDGKQYTILFLLTGQNPKHTAHTEGSGKELCTHPFCVSPSESGFIHKVVLLERGPWVIEEIQVFREPQRVKNMVLSLSKVNITPVRAYP